ncbi:hypothetical protein M758_6G046900 [Ceratodon purpureus]|nr:hypothetical protein M758_6G046900 [Ceratodon purpureus]
MPCLQWTIGGGGLVLPQLHVRRVRGSRGAAGHARAGLRQWGGKMEWNGVPGAEKGRAGKGSEGESVKAAASMSSGADDTDAFCIIEGRDTVMDFAQMDLQEIRDNITRRRNKIFLLMEEVRRLRIQHKIKSTEKGIEDVAENEEMPEYTSAIPLLAPMTEATLQQYLRTCLIILAGIVLFGGLIAPVLELKLGIGGTSYKDFIRLMHLPMQLSEVDPIVASFSGGAVGVITTLMVVELNNVKRQEQQRCRYCHGTGYLACARCAGSGSIVAIENGEPTSSQRCPNCAGATKVMCPTCLCTGMALASEHDPRIDPFQ